VYETVLQIAARRERIGETLALAIVITQDTERPSRGMENRIQEALDEVAPMVACTAITILGSGFFASFFMSMLSRVLTRSKPGGSPQRLHTNLEAAASWMHSQLDDPDTSQAEILETLSWAYSNAGPLPEARAL
jgi:hypothetical protein